ncbi:MAG: DUF1648 domain-containing protein [Micrococcales bacterium]|nr:DUF1648 domain-containing protein [Micrococcales bacterium]OJX66165.1 MAG: hypothetical protein BGO94_04430 [Micrococcales bacterium 72-143]
MTRTTARPPRARLPFSVWIVAVALPVVVWGAAVALQLAWLPQLPDPVAIHWGPGGADGFASPSSSIALTAGLGVGLTGLFALVLATVRGASPTVTHKLLAVISLVTSVFTGFTVTASLGVQLGLDDARDAPDFGGWAVVGLAAAAVVGVIAWLVLPRAVRPGEEVAEVAPLPLVPGERSAWIATVRIGTAIAVVIVSAVGLVTVSTVAAVIVSGGLIWPLLLFPLLLIAMSATSIVWRVRVDATGLTVRSVPLGWPRRRIRVADIESVKTVQVEPLAEFGGWGWRWTPVGGLGVVARAGEGILVVLRDGRRFTVTVDDAETGAALLAGYVASAPGSGERGPQDGSARHNG